MPATKNKKVSPPKEAKDLLLQKAQNKMKKKRRLTGSLPQ